jgi:hypothetical protein
MPRAVPSLLALACVVGAVAMAPAARATDSKSFSPSLCQPYAPDTSAAELQYTHTGIYNPGTTTEKVLCTVPRDQETELVTGDIAVAVHYRVLGATPARLTCSLFVGSTSHMTAYAVSTTASGNLISGGNRDFFYLIGGTQSESFQTAPMTLVCVIPPKTSFGGFDVSESKPTENIPPTA